jgi:hypothetical protein
MTPNERKAAERQRRRDAGLVPIEVWVPASRKAELVAAIAALIKPPAPADHAPTAPGQNDDQTPQP